MSVRKRTWFTNLQRKEVDPKAKEIAIVKGKPGDWKDYIDRAAELLGIQPQESWIVDYSLNGSRHIETFERKKDADAREAEVTVNVGKGIHIAPGKTPTVREAGEQWLKSWDHIERTTADTYRQHLHLHIDPYLGHYRLAHLTPPVIRQFEDDLRAGKPAPFPPDEKPHERFRQKRSPAMVKKVVTTLGNMLADMQERGLVAINAVHALSKGRKHKRKSKQTQQKKLERGKDFPTPKEITDIIANLSGYWRPMLLTAIFTGLRASELRGLRWKNVDLKNGKLHVRERVDRYLEVGMPKSEAGERTIPLPPMLVNTLREHSLKSEYKAKDDLVFPTSEGNAHHYANVLHRGLEPAQIAAKIVDDRGKPKYSLHALRHFYASWCINRPKEGGLGLPPKIVQERMGHSSITITMDRYGHLFPSDDDGSEMKEAEKKLLPV
jgi:integrase